MKKPIIIITITTALCLGGPAVAQLGVPPMNINVGAGGISPRAHQMKADARATGNDSQGTTPTTQSTSTSQPAATSPSSGQIQQTPTLHKAAEEGRLEDVKQAVAAKPEAVKSKDGQRFTALHYAAEGGQPEIVEFLLAQGADVNAVGSRGETSLYLAASSGQVKVIEQLLAGGAGLELANAEGRTPLIRAAMAGQLDALKVLLAAGADPKAKDRQGRTARDLAERYRAGDSSQVIAILSKAEQK